MRTEKDYLGPLDVCDECLYGIHSMRAKNNFPDTTPFHIEWYKALGIVKLACYKTYKSFKDKINGKFTPEQLAKPSIKLISDDVINSMIQTADEVANGKYYEHFIVPAVSGGAGTSINMNVNEIIANASLISIGYSAGNYEHIDPIETANVFQSTNDCIPTSLKVAIMYLLDGLEDKINKLRLKVEEYEKENRNNLKIAYTQMQEAVPTSYGKLFSTYSDALSRDWWRVSKCFERIKVVNLGGTAIGTGIGAPRQYIMEVVSTLASITGKPLTRSENSMDATSNLDSFVEVHAILKAHAVNLEKMVSDLRLLASDMVREIKIPQKQAGSSIMPGKVNPVIPEFVISACHRVYSNDSLISSLCAQGCLELNAYIPVIGHALIESLKLLIGSDETLSINLFTGMEINSSVAKERLYSSPSITTALIPYIGYNKACEMANLMKKDNIDIFAANSISGIMDENRLKNILKPDNLLKMGYSVREIVTLS